MICIFLGLGEESKAYKLYNPIKTKIIVRRDVSFEESKQWNWEKNEVEQIVTKNEMRNTDKVTYSASNHSEDENDPQEPEVNNEMQPELDEQNAIVSDSEDSNDEDQDLGKRVHKRLAYLDDYVTAENIEAQTFHNLVVFSSSENRNYLKDECGNDCYHPWQPWEVQRAQDEQR
jgi:hypothetical protein